MPRTESLPRSGRTPRRGLATSAAWSHRWGTLSWVAGGGAFLAYFGFGYYTSVRTTQGGAAAFGSAAALVADAMRPLSGAAERLDTYGGYTTYHNTSIAAVLLALWAALQGARAIRGWEERGALEVWLATGRRRWTVVRDQSIGMLASLAFIAVGIGVGFGGGAVAAGEPNWVGAGIVGLELSLVAASWFAIGLLISQLTSTARAAAGLTAILMVGLYVVGNMAPELGWFGWIRFLSPFFYFQQSRALVPGHSIDPMATAVLVLAAGAAVALAALAFERRDVASPLWRRANAPPEAGFRRTIRLSAPWLRDAWLADLRSQWVGLALWALGSATLMVMLVAVAKQVTTVWESSELLRRLFFKVPGSTFTDEYMTYVTTLAAIVPVAFVVAEASRWVGDISEGRAEALLAVSGSRLRIILEWAASALAGIIFVSAAVLVGCVAGAAIAGVDLRVEGLVRTLAAAILLGAAVCGVALLAVAVFRSGFAVGALGAVLGLGFMVTLFGPMFNLPDWVVRLSPFAAFGTPYASAPRPSGIALMAAMALVGTLGASLVAQRRGSVT